MFALGEKSSCDDDANGKTLPDKKKAAAQNDEQPTDEGRGLIARKPAENHHQTDGQMNKR